MDPYREWLGIDPKEGPPSAYRLLGLKPFEPDAATVRSAITRTRSRLEPHKRGRHAEQCRRLLDQVLRAEKVLTDPARKRSYDDGLRAKLGAARPGPGGAASHPGGLNAPPRSFVRRIRWPGLEGADRAKLAVAGVCLTATLGLLIGQARWHPRFPTPLKGIPKAAAVDLGLPRLPPRPATPSLLHLPLSLPRALPIPDLESFGAAYSPCLSADLKTIIFAATTRSNTGYDLYIATRNHPDQPFRTPELLAECSSELDEASPALSSNGLELIFMRAERGKSFNSSVLLHSIRASTSAAFSAPEPIPAVDALAATNVRLDAPQFLADGLEFSFQVVTLESKGPLWRYMASKRADSDSLFEKPRPLEVFNPVTMNFLSTDGLRAYVLEKDGVQISNRSSVNGAFGPQGSIGILRSAGIGPADGPFWVAPKEDVLFYCSPGVGKEPGSSRKLWMVRFR